MSEDILYILLDTINKNGSVNSLRRKGLTFSEIAQNIEQSVSKNYVVFEQNKITLSELGLKILGELRILHKQVNKDLWIEKESKSRIPKIDVNTVFLPSQDNLPF